MLTLEKDAKDGWLLAEIPLWPLGSCALLLSVLPTPYYSCPRAASSMALAWGCYLLHTGSTDKGLA